MALSYSTISDDNTGIEKRSSRECAEWSWSQALERFYHSRTNLFYDYVSSHDASRRLAHLPVPQEIVSQIPNTNGWNTGMEDSTINSGVVMSMLCDRYSVTGESALIATARNIFSGMLACGTLSPSEGLVLRSISPFDAKSYYIESSRDQYTHFVHGLWRYFHSGLVDKNDRQKITNTVSSICRRMERNVCEKNDYHILMEDGRRGIVDKMWQTELHELARLPMIYAVGYDLSGDAHWREMYLKYAHEASRRVTESTNRCRVAYALFQEQTSYEALYEIEKEDLNLKDAWAKAMMIVADIASDMPGGFKDYYLPELVESKMNWRHWPLDPEWKEKHGYAIHAWPEMLYDEMRAIREPCEALLIQMMCRGRNPPSQYISLLKQMLQDVRFDRCVTYSVLYPAVAYWRAVVLQLIDY